LSYDLFWFGVVFQIDSPSIARYKSLSCTTTYDVTYVLPNKNKKVMP
jgi:hypothetical protein